MPRETLARLSRLRLPVHFIHGNGELAVLAQIDAADPSAVAYWGTTSGNRPPESVRETFRWTAVPIASECEPLRRWPTGADWLILGPDVELRRTAYDFHEAAAQVRATTYPEARQFAESIVQPPAEAAMLDIFTAIRSGS